MKKIEAKIVADSMNLRGDRITTFLLTFPRFILSELNTHRVFSKNSASSRAIPFEKMVKMVDEDPFIPIAWQKDHSGMQGNEYITDETDIELNKKAWLSAKGNAISSAKYLNHGVKEVRDNGVTKQLCNRLLEPFMWHTVLLTATEFDNFFELRCPKYPDIYVKGKFYKSWKEYLKHIEDTETLNYAENLNTTGKLINNKGQAEIHMMALAEAMWDAYDESNPKLLNPGEWHIPFGDKIDEEELGKLLPKIQPASVNWRIEQIYKMKIKIATARCARLSYMTFDGEIDYEKDIKLHDTLLESHHMSPFEHCARAMTETEYYNFIKGPRYKPGDGYGWSNNFKGFTQYRFMIENRLDLS